MFVTVAIITVIVCLHKRKMCRKQSPDISHTSFNNEVENIPQDTNSVVRSVIGDIHCESGYESGYQSLQQPSSFSSQESVDRVDSCANSNLGPTNELIAVDEAANDLMGISEVQELFVDSIPEVSVCVVKLIQNENTNLTSELFSNAETQTFQSKETNQRDTFGRPYQHSQYLDKFNRTVQWDRSDTKMTIPASAVALHTLYVLASSFNDILTIIEKFCLSADDRLVSPVVEYCLTGCKKLDEHALVEMPIINDGKCRIGVNKFCSDSGINQLADLEQIPVLEEEDFSYDTFCIIKKEKALIFTKTFSGFFCVTHGRRANISLQAFLFGSYKKVMQNQEVRLNLYIADELHRFRDYNQVTKFSCSPLVCFDSFLFRSCYLQIV